LAFSQRVLFPIDNLGRRSLTLPLAQATMNMAFGQGLPEDPCESPLVECWQTAEKPEETYFATMPSFQQPRSGLYNNSQSLQ